MVTSAPYQGGPGWGPDSPRDATGARPEGRWRPPPPPRKSIAPPAPRWPLHRDRRDAWLGGVASGLAHHLGWPVWLVRVCFIGLTLGNMLTVLVYGALWMLIPDAPADLRPPGLEAASHLGLREVAEQPKAPSRAGRIIAVAMIAVGSVILAAVVDMGVASGIFWPVILAAVGAALVWLQADASDEDAGAPAGVPKWVAPLLTTNRWAATVRIILGMGLVGAAVSMLANSQIGVGQVPVVLWVSGLTLAGVGVVAAPWVLRYHRRLDAAREQKLVADTRADMAAHLHDSVLQTLALIQQQADDPRRVASLARRQERELRAWLYADALVPGTVQAALMGAGAAVEDEFDVPVEVVCVGDIELTADLRALVQAAREAMVNAAKHSGADMIDVYAEVDRESGAPLVQVFVRDRGRGFDLREVAEDRMGMRGSIIGRMERHGGSAKVRSALGEGTEIQLEMKA